jgi:hypothetical protein
MVVEDPKVIKWVAVTLGLKAQAIVVGGVGKGPEPIVSYNTCPTYGVVLSSVGAYALFVFPTFTLVADTT